MKRIAIIGGGAAGLMVAATLAESFSRNDIYLFEKNKILGSKIRISGGGRCNVTTGYYKKQDLQKKYTRGRDFLSHSIAQFGPRKMQQRCKDNGCELYCQDDLRCFPVSNKGSDIVAMFEKILERGGAHIHTEEPIVTLSKQVEGKIFSLNTTKDIYEFDIVVITTGGNAHGETGSTGDGYSLAQFLGHTITPLGPSLNSFLVQEEWIKNCSGISFQNATLSATETIATSGPLLLTHFGISGPVTFSLSSHIPHIPLSQKNPVTIYCKPFAEYGYDRWIKKLTEKSAQEPRKHLDKILEERFPKRRVDYFVETHFSAQNFTKGNEKNLHSIQMANLSNDHKKHLANLLGSGFPITLLSRRPGDEFVTAGGVNTNEVNPKTMESTICPGLFFAGEVLNIDGVTGGFNFQAARSTGRCAGENIGK